MSNYLKKIRLLLDCKITFGNKGLDIFRKIFTRHKEPLVSAYLPGLPQPFYLRTKTTDIDVFGQVFLKEQYRFSKHINDSEVQYIVDCGANVGMSVLHFLRKYPAAQIVAVELEQSNFELLQKNVSGYKNVQAVHAGIWSENTLLDIPDMSASHWMFTAEKSANAGAVEKKGNEVEGMTIQTLMERYQIPQIDLLKIDVESAEKEIFGADVSFLDKTRILVIELHDYMKPNTSKTFFEAISKYNYQMFISGENLVCEFYHNQ